MGDEQYPNQAFAEGVSNTLNANRKASPAPVVRARQVFVEVSGGIAEITVTGEDDVDVILIDWDNVDDADSEYVAATLDEAQGIADEETRERVVHTLERKLEAIKESERWSEEHAKTRRSEERERAASLLGIVEGSPAWDLYTREEEA